MKDIVSDEAVLGGTPRLDGTRIGVVHIYRQHQDGASPEAIASNYDDVTVADIHNALASSGRIPPWRTLPSSALIGRDCRPKRSKDRRGQYGIPVGPAMRNFDQVETVRTPAVRAR